MADQETAPTTQSTQADQVTSSAAETTAQENEPKQQVEIIDLSDADQNPFTVLGFDVSGGKTLTMEDFLALDTATTQWSELSEDQRKAYEQLGFDPSGQKHTELRAIKILDGTSETPWSELTEEQHRAAIDLGCDANGVRHEMGRLATIANRMLLKDPEIKTKKWDMLTPAQQAAATMLGHDNGGSIWNVRVEREWCENGVSPNSSLQNPFALPKGPESLFRIARNMGIELVGAQNTDSAPKPRIKDLCIDTDDDVIAATTLLPTSSTVKCKLNDSATTSADDGVAVTIYAKDEARFDPSAMPVSDIVDRCTKLEITVTEPGTIGMRWDDSESAIIAGVTAGLPADRLGVRPGFRVVAVQGQWVESVSFGHHRRFVRLPLSDRVRVKH